MDDEFEFDIDPEELKRSIQDCNDGFTYEMLFGDDHKPWDTRCNKCKREGNMMERPFPHKLNCPMRDRIKD